ncbi:glycosyltransferase [Treponema bryantii]|uniref:glycosyltransferase n=1 Tax=Treponema bryantii TaxID=163 RepID=UPI002B2A4440|nr:hypothetical protein TRBR_26710 [Treponema bryantii]
MEKSILTIGITTFGNKIAQNVIDFLKGQPIDVIISENKEDLTSNKPSFFYELQESGVNTKYIYCEERGIANNRQKILDNVCTKYFYTIDNDDSLTGNIPELVTFLSNNDYDALYIRCYEDGKYMHIPHSFIYMCTWMQIFKTEWIRELGGYVQSWNFIHEESATNINWRTNLGDRPYKRIILPKRLISYNYHANSACVVSFDVSKVCEFIDGIQNNKKIKNKEKFLELFMKFTEKYIRVYRVNDKNTVYIDNFINGSYEDIIDSINNQKQLIK